MQESENQVRPPCRADHIGSLLRPRSLKDAHGALRAGRIDAAQFAAVQDEAIRQAVKMQERAGVGAVTDGEFRRRSWLAGFVDAVDGLTHRETRFSFKDDAESGVSVPVPHVESRLRRTRGITTDEFSFLKPLTQRRIKVTLPAPSVMHFFRGPEGIDPATYAGEDAFWDDLIKVYQQEIRELDRLGCTYLQLDEVPIALLCDPAIRERITAWGWNWQDLLRRYTTATNEVLSACSARMTVGMHLCRGNFRGHWIGSGGYEPVAEILFNETRVNHFLLEFDSERAGGFEPLRFVPGDKSVVLGLVSTKTAALEEVGDLCGRIDRATAMLPLERLALSPQCGFGTTVGGAPMTDDQQRLKLTRVVEVATRVWGNAA